MNKYFLLSGVAFFGAIMPMAAQAQSQAGNPPGSESVSVDSDIVVTARRREERLQTVPVAITAFSGEALKERSVTTFVDLQASTPSLAFQGAAGRRDTPSMSLRGQRTSDTQIVADASVAVYMDEVVLTPNQGINLGLFDLQNVQVLKGPQGTLFGRNSTGGAVLFTTAKPTDKLGAGITAHYGNYNEVQVQGYLNLPLSDTLRVRVAGNYLKNDGYAVVVGGTEAGHRLESADQQSIRAISVWEPFTGVKNTTTFEYDHSDGGGAAFVLTAVSPATTIRFFPGMLTALARQQARSVREVEASSPIHEKSRATLLVNTTEIELGEVKFKNIFGYRKMDYDINYDGDDSPLPVFYVQNPAHTKQFTDEMQFLGNALNGKMNWITGLYFFNQKGSDISLSNSFFGVNPNAPGYTGPVVNNTSFSGYVQQTTEVLPKLSLTTGFRFTVDRRRTKVVQYTAPTAAKPNKCQVLDDNGVALTFNPALPYNGCTFDLEKTFTSPTWTISLDYKLDPNKLLYVSSRRGYRTGGFNGRASDKVQRLPFNPETVTDFEAGLKMDTHPAGMLLRTNLAAYLQKYNSIQRSVTLINPFTGSVTSSIINAAKARIWGIEAETTLIPTRSLELSANYSYVNARYTNFPAVLADKSVVQYTDRRFAGVPVHQFNASIKYTPIDDDQIGKVTFFGSYSYRSGYFINEVMQTPAQIIQGQEAADRAAAAVAIAANKPVPAALAPTIPNSIPGLRIPGVGLLNARLSWDNVMGSNFGLAVYGKNLANKTYANSGLSLYESLGTVTNTYGDPRTYGIEASYRF